MFGFLKKLLPPANEGFYTLLDDAAVNCKDTAHLLSRICEEGVNAALLEEARRLKHESADIDKAILRLLNETFITPIDREDIQTLTTLLNQITRRIVKACFNLQVYQMDSASPNLKSQVSCLTEAADHLIPILGLIRNTSQVEEATRLNRLLKELETRGDDIMNHTMTKLFSQGLLPLEVMKSRIIHKEVESALDQCYTVSDEVLSILLKHS